LFLLSINKKKKIYIVRALIVFYFVFLLISVFFFLLLTGWRKTLKKIKLIMSLTLPYKLITLSDDLGFFLCFSFVSLFIEKDCWRGTTWDAQLWTYTDISKWRKKIQLFGLDTNCLMHFLRKEWSILEEMIYKRFSFWVMIKFKYNRN
jgi:hypothetical protein